MNDIKQSGYIGTNVCILQLRWNNRNINKIFSAISIKCTNSIFIIFACLLIAEHAVYSVDPANYHELCEKVAKYRELCKKITDNINRYLDVQ